jgi:hypothetical protein
MGDKFKAHEAAKGKAEAATARYERSIKEAATKISTDKGGKTERLVKEHTKRSK